MSEGRVPSPDFDASRYERPNARWVCGHACEGRPCRVGPSPSGACRATAECAPRLVVQPGETKGTWQCTRPAEWGGPCRDGPLPDGACSRPIARCRPVRSLRARRGLVSRAVVAACVGALLLGLSPPLREAFVNPRPLSRQHAGAEFAHLAAAAGKGQGCALCHAEAKDDLAHLVRDAVAASRASLRPASLGSREPKDLSRLDPACLACHKAHAFHEPDVAQGTACAACHREHLGAGPLAPVPAQACVECHGSAPQMLAAREICRRLPAAAFARAPAEPGMLVHAVARPPGGLTELITGFAADHPEFRVLRTHSPDANTLKFNHRVHLTGPNVPRIGGRPLDCASCHRPDASGAYMGRLSFERDCRACHALAFDERNPGLTLPHGDTAYVRAFLRSLPTQYADYAQRRLGLAGHRAADGFVERQLRSLRERFLGGDELERAVFLSDGRRPASGGARPAFEGCATCHEVAWRAGAGPAVTAPRTPDRWLPGASFTHAKHASLACAECHAAAASERTSDVLLPTRESCARCHSPRGGAPFACASCHRYHNPAPETPEAARLASLP